MTKLEEEIYVQVKNEWRKVKHPLFGSVTGDTSIQIAKAAAEVAKRYIEKAYDQGLLDLAELQKYHKDPLDIAHMTGHMKEEWLKENGVV